MANGNMPTINDPSGPGIRLANILLFLPLMLNTIEAIAKTAKSVVKIGSHIFARSVEINYIIICKRIFIILDILLKCIDYGLHLLL